MSQLGVRVFENVLDPQQPSKPLHAWMCLRHACDNVLAAFNHSPRHASSQILGPGDIVSGVFCFSFEIRDILSSKYPNMKTFGLLIAMDT